MGEVIFMSTQDLSKIRLRDSQANIVLVKDVIEVIVEASYKVLKIYNSFESSQIINSNSGLVNEKSKGGDSDIQSSAHEALTNLPMDAYNTSCDIMKKMLARKYPDIPIICPLKDESSNYVSFVDRKHSEFCFILSPLDGELDFLKLKKDGFCTSIGLTINGFPSLGIICTPYNMDVFCGIIDGVIELESNFQRGNLSKAFTQVIDSTKIDNSLISGRDSISGGESNSVSLPESSDLDSKDDPNLKTFSFALAIDDYGDFDKLFRSHNVDKYDLIECFDDILPNYFENVKLTNISNKLGNLNSIMGPSPVSSPSGSDREGFQSSNFLRIGVGLQRLSEEMDLFKSKIPDSVLFKINSSSIQLRLLAVASGLVDIYPQFSITNECQTCAGHALVLGTGGEVLFLGMPGDPSDPGTSTSSPTSISSDSLGSSTSFSTSQSELKTLSYNKEFIINPQFIAYGRQYKQEVDISKQSKPDSQLKGEFSENSESELTKDVSGSKIWLNVILSLAVLLCAIYFNVLETILREI